MGIRFYNLNGFFVKKLAHGVLSLYYTRKKRLCQYRFSYFIYHFPYILQRKYGKMR